MFDVQNGTRADQEQPDRKQLASHGRPGNKPPERPIIRLKTSHTVNFSVAIVKMKVCADLARQVVPSVKLGSSPPNRPMGIKEAPASTTNRPPQEKWNEHEHQRPETYSHELRFAAASLSLPRFFPGQPF